MNSGIGAFLGALAVYVFICRSINQAKDGSSPSKDSSPSAAEEREGQPAAGADGSPASIAFDFSLLYKIAMPVMFAALLPLDAVVPAWRFLADTCALFSYTMLLVLIMAILSNLFLLLVAQQRTLGEMARELYIGTNTVKTHTKHVYQKLGVHSRAEVLELLGVRE